MNRYVYLAGPITACSEGEAKDWRSDINGLFISGIKGISPLRGEPSPDGERYTPTDQTKFRSSKAIAAKNHYDTHNCDAVLAYLPKEYNDRRPSYGTIF